MCVCVFVHKKVEDGYEGGCREGILLKAGEQEKVTMCDMKAGRDALWKKEGASKRRAGTEGA